MTQGEFDKASSPELRISREDMRLREWRLAHDMDDHISDPTHYISRLTPKGSTGSSTDM